MSNNTKLCTDNHTETNWKELTHAQLIYQGAEAVALVQFLLFVSNAVQLIVD
jgi:hypothetical protein